MSKYYVLDSNGTQIYPPPPKKKRNTSVTTKLLTSSKTPPSFTLKMLSKLEDAIFEDGPEKRLKFLNLYRDIESSEDIDTYLIKHESRKKKALVHCWVKLGWRPNHNATKVLDKNINPYVKD